MMPDTIIAGGRGTPAEEWAGELSALESRAEIDSLADLQQRRRVLVETNARLIARYGPFGLHDDYRKRMAEALKIKARMELTASGGKTTEGMIDAHAYGSEEYERFLDNALTEKIEYLRVQNGIDDLNERIRSREIALLSYNAEARLGR